jgi:hypothetical protein
MHDGGALAVALRCEGGGGGGERGSGGHGMPCNSIEPHNIYVNLLERSPALAFRGGGAFGVFYRVVG